MPDTPPLQTLVAILPRDPSPAQAPFDKWEEAEGRASALLASRLTLAEREELIIHDRFTVTCRSGASYRIMRGWSNNVRRLLPAGKVESLCVHFGEMLPIPYLMLTQKLALETDEDGFRAKANIMKLPADERYWW